MAVRPNRRLCLKILEPLEDRRLLSATGAVDLPLLVADKTRHAVAASSIPGYTPTEIRTSYGISSAQLSNGDAATGAGQTIAIVDAYNDPNIQSDLKTFDNQFGLPAASLSVVSQTGSTTNLPANNSSWDLEISLDVEWAHAVAPDASILLIETNSDGTNSLLSGVKYADSVADVSVVSMSWGGSEFNGENNDDADFTTPSGHQGITFVAASGDDGPMSGAEWPAVSPDVLGVGGTTLNLSGSGAYGSESAWSDSSGGFSQLESELSYQSDVQTTGARSAPDVAYDANPSTGVAVYDSVKYQGESGWQEIGGTSEGAPQWAGLVALADQDRVASELGTLDGTSQTLPTLYAQYSSSATDSAAFNPVDGSNNYNTMTGLGSPIASAVVSDLFNATTTTTTTVTPPTQPTGGNGNGGGRHRGHYRGGFPYGGDPFGGFPFGGFPTLGTSGHGWGHRFAIANTLVIATPSQQPQLQITTATASVGAMDSALAFSGANTQVAALAPMQTQNANNATATNEVALAAPTLMAEPASTKSGVVKITAVSSAIQPVSTTTAAATVAASGPLATTTLFSNTPLHAHAFALLKFIPSGEWAAALSAGVLVGLYVIDRRRRTMFSDQNFEMAA